MYPFDFDEALQSRYEYLQSLGLEQSIQMPDLLVTAFIHKSYAADRTERGTVPHNERLEFLGDAALGCAVSGLLYREYTLQSEAQLTLSKIYLVKESTLAMVARSIGLGAHIFLGYGENKSGGRDKDSVLSDALEACLGYLFCAYGLETVETFVKKHIYSLLQAGDGLPTKSYKSLLQELIQKLRKEVPIYEDVILQQEETGNVTEYGTSVKIREEIVAVGKGPSKKKAQEDGAQKAYELLLQRASL